MIFTDFEELWKNMEKNSIWKSTHFELNWKFSFSVKVPNIQSFVNQKRARTRQNHKYEKYSPNIKLQLSCWPNSKFSTKMERIIELKMDIYKSLTEAHFSEIPWTSTLCNSKSSSNWIKTLKGKVKLHINTTTFLLTKT